jgi:hypothetical protein
MVTAFTFERDVPVSVTVLVPETEPDAGETAVMAVGAGAAAGAGVFAPASGVLDPPPAHPVSRRAVAATAPARAMKRLRVERCRPERMNENLVVGETSVLQRYARFINVT